MHKGLLTFEEREALLPCALFQRAMVVWAWILMMLDASFVVHPPSFQSMMKCCLGARDAVQTIHTYLHTACIPTQPQNTNNTHTHTHSLTAAATRSVSVKTWTATKKKKVHTAHTKRENSTHTHKKKQHTQKVSQHENVNCNK